MKQKHTLELGPFFIDRFPVTCAQYNAYLVSSGYKPEDAYNFLKSLNGSMICPASLAKKPVTYVSQVEARLYCAHHGKRLPHSYEWQLAAQGTDGRKYPWGSVKDQTKFPTAVKGRIELADVDAFSPLDESPFGVSALVGHVWQWTDEFCDVHTCRSSVRGGSNYVPATSGQNYYFKQALELNKEQKYLTVSDSYDRSGTFSFRCVADAASPIRTGLKTDDIDTLLPPSHPLAGVPRLPKMHFMSNVGLRAADLAKPDILATAKAFARVAGSLTANLNVWGTGYWPNASHTIPAMSDADIKLNLQICAGANASIVVAYSPWYAAFNSTDPTIEGDMETNELQLFINELRRLVALAEPFRVPIPLVIFDSEKLRFTRDSTPEWRAALTRKHDLMHNASKAVLPTATVVHYDYGAVGHAPFEWPASWNISQKGCDHPESGWCAPFHSGMWTGREIVDVFSTSLYTLNEPMLTQLQFNKTATLALERGVNGIVPILALGSGNVRAARNVDPPVDEFCFEHDYPLANSWQLGAQANRPEYAAKPERFGLWEMATAIGIFPGPFWSDAKSGAWSSNTSTQLRHFAAYAKGAALLSADESVCAEPGGRSRRMKTDETEAHQTEDGMWRHRSQLRANRQAQLHRRHLCTHHT